MAGIEESCLRLGDRVRERVPELVEGQSDLAATIQRVGQHRKGRSDGRQRQQPSAGRRVDRDRGYLEAAAAEEGAPTQVLNRVIEGIAEDARRYHRRGCPFIYAAAE
ncbi:hypothetical protein AB0H36_40945 [Kribbella sp. NPDC050820]|uniref:hypothetical protein n=1 Tax=Kribbella sp. NPDC050820 TaxID=3155408 RepID=UPI00340DC710